MASQATTLPDFPVFDIDEPEAVFGCDLERYIPRSDSGVIGRELRSFEKIAQAFFFRGGSLADHGIEWRPEIDGAKAMRCLRGLLGSFAPAHEQKTATVALALHHWTQPLAA